MHIASMRLLEEINDVLDLQRLSDPSHRLTLEQVNLRLEAQQIVRLVQSASGGNRSKLEIDIPESFELLADRRSVVTILGNLISNAIKYSPRGGKIEIQARALAAPWQAEIKVTDQGVGIPSGRLADIFNPFVRLHEADLPAVGGTGLGLSIVKMLTERHGGQIRADSEPGKGTTMTLMLPADLAPALAVGLDIPEL